MDAVKNQARFGFEAKTEVKFFESQQLTSVFLTVLGTIIAILLSIGAMFAAANTMYAAVSARTREIGTMRALGFSRRSVLASFLGESLILCALGGLLGWLATWPFRAWSFGINDFTNFSERAIQLRFGPLVFAIAFGMTLAMGVFGGLFPAVRAVRLNVVKSLREL
jgi:putative ABC transport system permease protein